MSLLPSSVKEHRLDEILLLGSHDSGAYQLDLNATTHMEKTPILNLFKELAEIDPLANQIVKNLTLSQPLSIIEQLEQGIRAFDFRFLYNNLTQEFYLSHSYATTLLQPVLQQMGEFLANHTGEILVIRITDDYEHEESTGPLEYQVVPMIQNALGAFLIPVSASGNITANMTLSNLAKSNQRVLIRFLDYFWPHEIMKQHWPNGQTVNESMSIINTYLPKLNQSAQGFLNLVFFTITPDAESIIKNILVDWGGGSLPDSLVTWAGRIYPYATQWIQTNLQRLHGLNIISVDAPNDNYVEDVIGWNSIR